MTFNRPNKSFENPDVIAQNTLEKTLKAKMPNAIEISHWLKNCFFEIIEDDPPISRPERNYPLYTSETVIMINHFLLQTQVYK